MMLENLGMKTSNLVQHKCVQTLRNFTVSCIEFDVSSAPVSLALPLSRLFAGLTLELEKYNLDYNSEDFNIKGKPSPEQLMEPILSARVALAQVSQKRKSFKGRRKQTR